MTTDNDATHRRTMLATYLRRLLVTDESLARKPDDGTMTLDRANTSTQINDLAAKEGLGLLPDALPAIAIAVDLRAVALTSLQRQQQALVAYQQATEILHAQAAASDQITLALRLQQTNQRLREVVQQLAALQALASPPPVTPPRQAPWSQPPIPPPALVPERAVPMSNLTLSSDQHHRLWALLQRCNECGNNRDLQTLFSDQRLQPWRDGLPEADNLRSRVDRLIAYLLDKRNIKGEWALVLLLQVLAERYHPADERRDTLWVLANELQYGVRAIFPPASLGALERTIRVSNSMFDVIPWITQLITIQRCVCRLTVAFGGKTEHGTGFLLAPDIVLTNYHVVERVLAGKAPASSVSLLFDYHMQEDGVTPHVGTSYQLATQEWLIDASPYSSLDRQPPSTAVPAPDELDYALLRVAGAPGNEEVTSRMGTQRRGWLALPEAPYAFEPNTLLTIIQHPEGKELKLAFDTDALIEVNANATRVRYRTNTERGSSGSPCFDANWNLAALHHSGDPNYEELHQPSYNQGIPIAAIRLLLLQRGKLARLTTQP